MRDPLESLKPKKPKKPGHRFWIWLAVAAVVTPIGAFFLLASSDSTAEEAARHNARPSPVLRPVTAPTPDDEPVVDVPEEPAFSGEVAISLKPSSSW